MRPQIDTLDPIVSLGDRDASEVLPEPTPDSPESFDLWIEAGRAEKHYWADLWRYRELFYILAWRDVAVRYKQTVAGAAWALIQPFLSMS